MGNDPKYKCNNEDNKELSDVTTALANLGADPTSGALFFRSDGKAWPGLKEVTVPDCKSFRFFK